MKTAGQILHAARLSKKQELADVSRVTRIRPQFISAIESDAYQALPSGATAKGFIRNYCEFLGLPPHQILAVFRRDFVENEQGQIVPRGIAKPVSEISFWTPRTTVIAAVAFIFTIFAGYLFYQYRLLIGPPSLSVSQPSPDFQTTQNTVEVIGLTDPEATISVNDQLVALEKGGHFSFRLPLNSGPNTISITAISKSGKTSTLTRTVTLH